MQSYVSAYATGLGTLSIAGAGLVYSTIFRYVRVSSLVSRVKSPCQWKPGSRPHESHISALHSWISCSWLRVYRDMFCCECSPRNDFCKSEVLDICDGVGVCRWSIFTILICRCKICPCFSVTNGYWCNSHRKRNHFQPSRRLNFRQFLTCRNCWYHFPNFLRHCHRGGICGFHTWPFLSENENFAEGVLLQSYHKGERCTQYIPSCMKYEVIYFGYWGHFGHL